MSSDYLTVVASPLETDMATHDRLRRLTQIVAGGADTTGQLDENRVAVDELFGEGASIDRQRGEVGGGCWPLDPHWELLLLGRSEER